jgi:hypothetical protein
MELRSNAIEMFFKNMNDHISRNHQLAITDPQQAIANALISITEHVATQMVLRSRKDVLKWCTPEGAADSCHQAGQ